MALGAACSLLSQQLASDATEQSGARNVTNFSPKRDGRKRRVKLRWHS
jgi:hypothetical protein